MITYKEATRAINQLLSCTMGRAKAKASTHLEHSPLERIEFCLKLVHHEVQEIVQNTDAAELSKALVSGRIQLDSLKSLKTLAQLIDELNWE
tara:strand:+ start:2034 stop:2309 length:276 start_codon:yes stop_codon:yes gene_type:complete